MHADPVQQASAIIFGVPPFCLLIGGLLTVLMMRAKNLRTVGPVLAAERPGALVRRVTLSLLLLGALVVLVVVCRDARLTGFACVMLAPAFGLVWLGPGFQDALLGEHGVQRGWYSRRFDELEEWRVTGEHLRFRLFGEWTAVPCPADHAPRVRALLERTNATRESPFQD